MRIVTKAINAGAKLDVQDENGQIPLHIIVADTHYHHGRCHAFLKSKMVCTLVRGGPGAFTSSTATIKDKNGNLPIEYLGTQDTFDPTTAFILLQHMVCEGILSEMGR